MMSFAKIYVRCVWRNNYIPHRNDFDILSNNYYFYLYEIVEIGIFRDRSTKKYAKWSYMEKCYQIYQFDQHHFNRKAYIFPSNIDANYRVLYFFFIDTAVIAHAGMLKS